MEQQRKDLIEALISFKFFLTEKTEIASKSKQIYTMKEGNR
ncbi:hypothetical protein Clocel_3585 [Clostridium cellulovorans 743B]|jgi:hypothetical protein|uniref:Uncharacterized protein n=1 Tax=Clostridium cellulovorans (strain ATCC 35296 / DSM 3052 / OCM 3 / 743B) TaxID=573061 RepID=D9SWH8_CLOC7|nr:hypothetical protein Clocel_3585 [Clostridium cellulovorans 743B]